MGGGGKDVVYDNGMSSKIGLIWNLLTLLQQRLLSGIL